MYKYDLASDLLLSPLIFSSPQLLGREELYSYVSRPRRTILEVLGDFHSVRANLDMRYLLDFIPLIKPRGFSIASAQCVDKDRLQICMAVVR